eukprot:GDKJ01020947.1.p1 GENE.GDKJ01020947.1~~GDKJ01020947.1.p1  ORF type:complete len:887 (+),score=297.29 GDKJ01020947.1:32-2692(+)
MYDDLIESRKKHSTKKLVIATVATGVVCAGVGIGAALWAKSNSDKGKDDSSDAVEVCSTRSCVERAAQTFYPMNDSVNVCDDVFEALCGHFVKDDPLGPNEKDKYYSNQFINKANDRKYDDISSTITCDMSKMQSLDGIDAWKNTLGCTLKSCEAVNAAAPDADTQKILGIALNFLGSKLSSDFKNFSSKVSSASIADAITLITDSISILPFSSNPLFSLSVSRGMLTPENELSLIEGTYISLDGSTHLAFLEPEGKDEKKKEWLANAEKYFAAFNSYMGLTGNAALIDVKEAALRVFNMEQTLLKQARLDAIYLQNNIPPTDFEELSLTKKDGEPESQVHTVFKGLIDVDRMLQNLNAHKSATDAAITNFGEKVLTVHSREFMQKSKPILFQDENNVTAEELENLRLNVLLRILSHTPILIGLDENSQGTGAAKSCKGELLQQFPSSGNLNWIPSFLALHVDEDDLNKRREEIRIMLDGIIEEFIKRVDELTFLDDPTKALVKKKASMVNRRLAYPDFMKDEKTFVETLQKDVYYVSPKTLNEEVLSFFTANAAQFPSDKEKLLAYASLSHTLLHNHNTFGSISKAINNKPNRDIWGMFPTTVNAYYEPTANEVVIPYAIVQSPNLVIAAENENTAGRLHALIHSYGAIGSILGHELTHGFDNSGALYDEVGNLKTLWTEESIAGFDKMTKCLVDQYSTFRIPQIKDVVTDNHISGDRTLGENIADAGGLKLAFRALDTRIKKEGGDLLKAYEAIKEKKTISDEEKKQKQSTIFPLHYHELIPGIRGSPARLFLSAYAQSWCNEKSVKEWVKRQESDVHSPSFLRILGGFRNFDASIEAFECKSNVDAEGKLIEGGATFGGADVADVIALKDRKPESDPMHCNVW